MASELGDGPLWDFTIPVWPAFCVSVVGPLSAGCSPDLDARVFGRVSGVDGWVGRYRGRPGPEGGVAARAMGLVFSPEGSQAQGSRMASARLWRRPSTVNGDSRGLPPTVGSNCRSGGRQTSVPGCCGGRPEPQWVFDDGCCREGNLRARRATSLDQVQGLALRGIPRASPAHARERPEDTVATLAGRETSRTGFPPVRREGRKSLHPRLKVLQTPHDSAGSTGW